MKHTVGSYNKFQRTAIIDAVPNMLERLIGRVPHELMAYRATAETAWMIYYRDTMQRLTFKQEVELTKMLEAWLKANNIYVPPASSDFDGVLSQAPFPFAAMSVCQLDDDEDDDEDYAIERGEDIDDEDDEDESPDVEEDDKDESPDEKDDEDEDEPRHSRKN